MKVTDTFRLNAAADTVGRVLVDETFHLEMEREREGVVSTRYLPGAGAEGEVRFEMRSVEYKRTKTGKLDRSRTDESTIRYVYDKASRTLRWEFVESDRFRISGVYQLRQQGDGTEVTHEVEIRIRIPLIGGQIAKFIGREFKKEFPRYRRLVEKHIGLV